MNKWIKFIVILSLAGLLVYCNKVEDDNAAGVLLRVASVAATSSNGNTGSILYSDVLYKTSLINDVATINFTNSMMNQAVTPSFFNNVLLTRYRVTYKRPDNRNTPGMDVPFPFDEVMDLEIAANGSSATGITVVRAIAKDESPLVQLRNDNVPGEKVISAQAHMEFWGTDLAGRVVYCKGYLEVLFADWAD
jgi:hypothetical protein